MSASLLVSGVKEFNRGNFLEAHELWEEAWNETVGEEKRFYQGLVHIAAGYLKLLSANYTGARKLLDRGRQILGALPLDYAGCDLAPLLTASEGVVSSLAAGRQLTVFDPPRLSLRDSA